MAIMSTGAFSDAMKTWYLDGINDNSNRATVLLNRIQPSSEGIGGNFAYMSLLRRGNPGVGSRSETAATGAALPTANYSRYSKATFGIKSLYGRFMVTGQSIRATRGKGSRAAFVEALDSQMQSLMQDLPAEHNRMLFGDGTGLMATTAASATTASTTVTVDSTQYIQADDMIDVMQSDATTARKAGLTVASVTSSTAFVVNTTTSTTAATDIITRAGSGDKEIFGLEAVCATSNPAVGNYGNIDRTTGAGQFYQGNKLGNSGTNRPLTQGLMQQCIARSRKKGRGNINLGVSDDELWITYGNLLAPNQRFMDQIFEIDGGFKALNFAGVPIVADKDCKPNRMFFLDLTSLVMFQHEGYEWLDEDGGILKQKEGYDTWEGAMVKDCQLGCRHPNRNVWLADLSTNLN